MKKAYLFLWCIAVGILAYVILDFYNAHSAPLYKRLERQWTEDVEQLEKSGKLPDAWFDVSDVEINGGTAETKNWLQMMQIPVKPTNKTGGQYKLETLVIVWEEEGKRGTMVQYNLIHNKSKNNVWELGRTFILSRPYSGNPLQILMEEVFP